MLLVRHNILRLRNRLACFALLAACGTLATGCVVLPTPGRFQRASAAGADVNIRKVTGTAGSGRPVRPGVARSAIRARLGAPDEVLEAGRVERFDYDEYNWFKFCLIPLGHLWGDWSLSSHRHELHLSFDDRDRVESLVLERRW